MSRAVFVTIGAVSLAFFASSERGSGADVFSNSDIGSGRSVSVTGGSGQNKGENQDAFTQWTQSRQDVSSMPLPCTDDTKAEPPQPQLKPGENPPFPPDWIGPPEFGQVRCIKAKKLVIPELESKVRHIEWYYYHHRNVQFRDDASAGFCWLDKKANDDGTKVDSRPVCQVGSLTGGDELDTNQFNEQCNKRFGSPIIDNMDTCFGLANRNPVDPMKCGHNGQPNPAAAALYQGEIDSLQNFINDCAGSSCNKGLCASKYNFDNCDKVYRQAQIASEQKYLNNENNAFTEHMKKVWNDFTSSNNDYCLFTKSGVDFNTCAKEVAYLEGMKVGLYEKHLKEVTDEIKSNLKITLTELADRNDPTQKAKPCVELAMSLQYQLNGYDGDVFNRPGIRAAENWVRQRYQPLLEKVKMTPQTACLDDNVDSSASISSLLKATFDENGNSALPEAKSISQAACTLMIARKQAIRVFSKLALCEIESRVKRDWYEQGQLADQFWADLKKEVIDTCVGFAFARKSLNPFGDWCTEGCIVKCFNDCYRDGTTKQACNRKTPNPNIKGNVAHQGIEKWIQKWAKTHIGAPKIAPAAATERMKLPPLLKRKVADRVTNEQTTDVIYTQYPNGWKENEPVPDGFGYPTPSLSFDKTTNQVPYCEDVFGTAGVNSTTYVPYTPPPAPPPAGASGAMLVPFALYRRRRKRRRQAAARLRTWLGTLLAGVAVIVVFGTSCGDDEADAKQETKVDYICNPCSKTLTYPTNKCMPSDPADDVCRQTAESWCRDNCDGGDDNSPDPGTNEQNLSDKGNADIAEFRAATSDPSTIADTVIKSENPGTDSQNAAVGKVKVGGNKPGSGQGGVQNAKEGELITTNNGPGAAPAGTAKVPDALKKEGFGKGTGGAETSESAAHAGSLDPGAHGAGVDTFDAAKGRYLASSNAVGMEGGGGGSAGTRGPGNDTGEVGAEGNAPGANGDGVIKNSRLTIFEIVNRRYNKVSWKFDQDDLGGLKKAVLPSSNEFNRPTAK